MVIYPNEPAECFHCGKKTYGFSGQSDVLKRRKTEYNDGSTGTELYCKECDPLRD